MNIYNEFFQMILAALKAICIGAVIIIIVSLIMLLFNV